VKKVVVAKSVEKGCKKKRHSFEFLRTIAHLRPRTNTIGAVLRVRNAVSLAMHDFFQKRGFIPWVSSRQSKNPAMQHSEPRLREPFVTLRGPALVELNPDFS
jgi:aspartyl/asparaginyl-tRNA synthetase